MIDTLFDIEGKLISLGESTRTHQQDILIMHKGWNKFAPHLAVGIIDFVDDDQNSETIKSAITFEFERDGMTVNNIVVSDNGKINTDANY